MNSTKQKIWSGIAEIVAGEKHGDIARGDRGQEMVRKVLDDLPDNIRDAYNQVTQGAAEIEVGTRDGDADRVGWGWATVDDALLALNALRVDDAYTRMELHRAAMEMFDIAMPCLVGDLVDKFSAARELHQKCLAKLAGGVQ